MLLENFIISSVIFARQAIFSTLYIGKSSNKQDHFTCILILCDLSCKESSGIVKNCILDVWISPETYIHTPV